MKKCVGFIGAGNMAHALSFGIVKRAEVLIYDTDTTKAEALATKIGASFVKKEEIAKKCDYIFLAVKPNILSPALDGIRDTLKARQGAILVSMLAGTSVGNIEDALGFSMPIIRIMPNTPVAVGRGVVLWCDNGLSDTDKSEFVDIMGECGLVKALDESLIDAGTAISGCSPAFTYMFIDALKRAGEKIGLDGEVADELAKATVLGSAMLSISDGRSLSELTRAVCSPGGSTIEGVKILENELDTLVMRAVSASYEKTKMLGAKK